MYAPEGGGSNFVAGGHFSVTGGSEGGAAGRWFVIGESALPPLRAVTEIEAEWDGEVAARVATGGLKERNVTHAPVLLRRMLNCISLPSSQLRFMASTRGLAQGNVLSAPAEH